MSSKTVTPSRIPLSTYRLQFHQSFTFADATELVPYLDSLGVTDLYASPYLQARAGSPHGYDISSHARLNPEIGTPDQHAALTAALQRRGMGHLIDIVPNHMGIGEPENEWWMDVLENGPSSVYAPYFDIDWEPLKPELAGKVLLPVLGDQFGRVLESGELELHYEAGRFRIHYHDHLFPVSPKSSSLVLRDVLERMSDDPESPGDDRIELESIVTALEHLPPRHRTDPASVKERHRENVVTRRRLSELHAASARFRRALEESVREFNGRVGEPSSFDRLERLLGDQAYRLSYWRVAAEEINYRRFFDINDLAGVRVERGEVFQATHELILSLVQEGKVTALRIDHPDGLYDPADYLRRLQSEYQRRAGAPAYLLVEKILTGDEELPRDWPVAGTVGYELMNRLNGLFVDPSGEAALDAVYSGFVGHSMSFRELEYEKKKLILRVALASELNVLAYRLDRISERHRTFRDFTLGALTDALREIIACFPVYRTYIDAHSGDVSENDRAQVERAVRLAMRRNPTTNRSIFEFIRQTLLLEWPESLDEDARLDHARFVMKFQQLTGPVMAKGVEDTSFYVYNRLVSLNEVGGEPSRFGVTPARFHEWMRRRREGWPAAMNATSTHDTKRSEDVRARIDVLSEIPERWGRHVRLWAELNAPKKRVEEGEAIPDRNDEYLLYQTLLGAWPLEPMDAAGRTAFVERIQAYMEKATREAKVHTSWINPNEEYDRGLREFVAEILEPGDDNRFLADFLELQPEVARIGMLNALSQTLLKLTLPGVPDLYQGQEVWDFSLVDPDNRRPVDYERRRRMLEELTARIEEDDREALAAELMDSWTDGRIKLYLTRMALHLRRARPTLFLEGEYVPLEGRGEPAEHLFAFARRRGDETVVVIAPRLWAGLLARGDRPLPHPNLWRGAELTGPAWLAGRYESVFDGAGVEAVGRGDGAVIPLEQILGRFPVALLSRAPA